MLNKLILNISHEMSARGVKGFKGLQLDLQGCYDLTDKLAIQLVFDINSSYDGFVQICKGLFISITTWSYRIKLIFLDSPCSLLHFDY